MKDEQLLAVAAEEVVTRKPIDVVELFDLHLAFVGGGSGDVVVC